MIIIMIIVTIFSSPSSKFTVNGAINSYNKNAVGGEKSLTVSASQLLPFGNDNFLRYVYKEWLI